MPLGPPPATLHESHYLNYIYLDELIDDLIAHHEYDRALEAIQVRIRCNDEVLPENHRAKVTEYDRLAQVLVMAGDVDQAIQVGMWKPRTHIE